MSDNTERSTQARLPNSAPLWIDSMATAVQLAQTQPECRLRTRIRFDKHAGKPSLFVPTDMAELQPASLHYLHTFARRHDLTLVEDRRRVVVQPTVEKRDKMAPMIATGISLLLKQVGLPGMAKPLSHPHRLAPDNACIAIPQLIRMAAHAVAQSKRVVVLPNRMLVNVLGNNTLPIAGYACKLKTSNGNTLLSHFDSNNFRAIGYSTGEQYVMHVCLAGGPLVEPMMWSNTHTLTRTEFQFQLFPGKHPICDLGLLYATFYLDLTQTPKPWWLDSEFNNCPLTMDGQHAELQQKVS